MMMKVKQLLGLLKTEPIADKPELLAVCQQIAKTQLKRDTLTLQKDAEIQMIKDRYDAEIEAFNSQIEHEVKRIKVWAAENRKAEFGERQTFSIGGHVLEFHKSPGAVKCLDGKKEEDAVEFLVNYQGEDAEQLQEEVLRIKAELNKPAIQRKFRQGQGLTLTMAGLQIMSEESFTFTPNREELPDQAETSNVEKEAKAA
jgi:phage host-nuclease inhibitor protein Gam